MKLEINSQNKAKFFVLYYGQLTNPNGFSIKSIINDVDNNEQQFCLILKSIRDITDEDAINVAKISLGKSKLAKNISITNTTQKEFGFSFWLNNETEYMINWSDIDNFFQPTLICLDRATSPKEYAHNIIFVVDYLRQRGYLLPWHGLSVDDIINVGWALIPKNK